MDLIILTYDGRSELETSLTGITTAKEFQRAQAILLIAGGTSVAEVPELLRVSRQTVYNWLARFQS